MAAAENPTGRPTKSFRAQAEQRVQNQPTDVSGLSADEIGGLLYELEVHQEELSMQNEELRRLQFDLELSHESLADLYDFAPVGYVTLDADGTIIHANLATAAMLGSERSRIMGTRLGSYCDRRSKGELRDHLEKVLSSTTSQSCELKLATPQGALIDVRLHSNQSEARDTGQGWHCRVIMTDISKDKVAESKLVESETLFRAIFEQAAVGVAQLDSLTGVLLKVNGRYCEILGTPAESLLGKTWMELSHSDDLAGDLANMKRLRSGELHDFAMEKRLQRSDGSFVSIQLTVSPLWQPGEEPTTHIAIVEDITARKQAEESLRRSEERYRSLVTVSAATIWTTDSDGGFSSVQPMWEAFTGQPWEEHRGYGWARMLHPEDAERMTRKWREVVDQPKPYFSEGRIFHAATGEYRYCDVHATPLFNLDGSVREWIGFTIDNQDRKQAEKQLLEQHEITERILSNMQDGYLLADGVGQLLDVNAAYCEMVGYHRDELLAMNIQQLEAALPQAEIERRIAAIQHTGQMRFETAHRRRDGRLIDLDVSITVVPERVSGVPPIAAFVRDVTDRKRTERLLRFTKYSVDTCSVSIYWIRHDGSFLYVNEAVVEDFGYSRDAWLSMSVHNVDPAYPAEAWPEFWSALQRNQTLTFESRMLHEDGALIPVEITTNFLEFEGEEFCLAFVTKIGERSNAEFALATRNTLLEAIRKSQSEFVAGEAPQDTFEQLLSVLLNVTAGEYGFIGEVLHDDAGAPFLKTYAITNVAWDDMTRKFFDEQAPAGLEFRNLENLFGMVITSGRAVITNDPGNDPRHGGLPPGHPPLNAFMGLPIYSQNDLVGMVGVANCLGGVGKELVDLLDPFLATCGGLIDASRRERDRRETEEDLRESRERFRQVAENINEVFWLHDLVDNKVLYVSPRYENTWGRSTEALYADPLEWANAIHSEDRERVEKASLDRAEFDEWVQEYRIVRPDATERYIRDRAYPIRDESGTAIRLAGISEDITEQKNVELALRESEEKFRALTERSPAIVLIARLEQILYCNSMFSEITGYSREELLRTPLRDIVHPAFRDSIADRQRRRFKGEDVPRRYDGKIVTKSGEERWLDVSVQLIDYEGAPAALVTCVNLTERKRAEAALRQSEEALREVNASLEQRVEERTAELAETNQEMVAFARTVSHDLRAPLRAMEGFAAALAEDYSEQLDEEARQFIQHIIESATRMDALVRDLLAFSRLGRTELRLKSIRLDSIVTEARRQLSAEIEACDAQLDFAEHMPTVLGNKATLVQIVANLLSNAMKFVAEGVRPEIRAWAERQDNGMIRLWVEDNGIGIDDTYHDRIFRVFERLHGIESYPGTGIGLAIVARACERLGGRYGCEPQRDQGSRFWVEFEEGETHP